MNKSTQIKKGAVFTIPNGEIVENYITGVPKQFLMDTPYFIMSFTGLAVKAKPVGKIHDHDVFWFSKEDILSKTELVDERERELPHFLYPDEIYIDVKPVTYEERTCHGFPKDDECYLLETSNYGWFPTSIIMGTTNGIFDPLHPLSQAHGAFIPKNTGTAQIGIIGKNKLAVAIATLAMAGYKIIQYTN
jgi:hypothetical protein